MAFGKCHLNKRVQCLVDNCWPEHCHRAKEAAEFFRRHEERMAFPVAKYPLFQPYIVGLAPDKLAVVDAETMSRMFALFKMSTGCDLLVEASVEQFRRAAQLTAQRVGSDAETTGDPG